MNMLSGTIRSGGVAIDGGGAVALPGRELPADGTPVTVGIRPEHAEPGVGPIEISVGTTEMLGSETILHGETALGSPFTLARRGISRATTGDRVPVAFPEPFVHLFDAEGVTVAPRADWRSAYLT